MRPSSGAPVAARPPTRPGSTSSGTVSRTRSAWRRTWPGSAMTASGKAARARLTDACDTADAATTAWPARASAAPSAVPARPVPITPTASRAGCAAAGPGPGRATRPDPGPPLEPGPEDAVGPGPGPPLEPDPERATGPGPGRAVGPGFGRGEISESISRSSPHRYRTCCGDQDSRIWVGARLRWPGRGVQDSRAWSSVVSRSGAFGTRQQYSRYSAAQASRTAAANVTAAVSASCLGIAAFSDPLR